MQESVFLRFLSLILLLRAQGGSSQTASSCRNVCNLGHVSQSDELPELLCDVPDFTARIDYESFDQNTLFGLYLQCVNESSMDRLCTPVLRPVWSTKGSESQYSEVISLHLNRSIGYRCTLFGCYQDFYSGELLWFRNSSCHVPRLAIGESTTEMSEEVSTTEVPSEEQSTSGIEDGINVNESIDPTNESDVTVAQSDGVNGSSPDTEPTTRTVGTTLSGSTPSSTAEEVYSVLKSAISVGVVCLFAIFLIAFIFTVYCFLRKYAFARKFSRKHYNLEVYDNTGSCEDLKIDLGESKLPLSESAFTLCQNLESTGNDQTLQMQIPTNLTKLCVPQHQTTCSSDTNGSKIKHSAKSASSDNIIFPKQSSNGDYCSYDYKNESTGSTLNTNQDLKNYTLTCNEDHVHSLTEISLWSFDSGQVEGCLGRTEGVVIEPEDSGTVLDSGNHSSSLAEVSGYHQLVHLEIRDAFQSELEDDRKCREAFESVDTSEYLDAVINTSSGISTSSYIM